MARKLCELVLTTPPSSDVDGLIYDLARRRLCAAGHTDAIRTTYRWRGELHTADEVKAVLHTCTDCLPELEAAITRWHPYEVACIAHRPLTATEPYTRWVRDSTTPTTG